MLHYVLYAARARAKLTLQALSRQTGLTESYLSMLENGKRTPSAETLPILGSALSIPGDDMLIALAAGKKKCHDTRRPPPPPDTL
jgi:transcriptional regulator with XRE-family HTH domain